MSRTFKFAIAALAVATTFAPVAIAQTGIKEVSISVPYGDLDISSPAGGATLLKRIESAARKACGRAQAHSPLKYDSVSTCRREAVENVVRSAAIGTLTLAWSGKYPATKLASR